MSGLKYSYGSPYKKEDSEECSTTIFNLSQIYNNEQMIFPQCKKSITHPKLEYVDKNLNPICDENAYYPLQQMILKVDIATKSKNSKYEFQNAIISESKAKMDSLFKETPKYNLQYALQKFENDCLQPNKQTRQLNTLLKQISQQQSADILEQSLQKLKSQIIIISKDEIKLKKDDGEPYRKQFVLKIENYIQKLKETSLVLFKLVNLAESLSDIDTFIQEDKNEFEEIEGEIKKEMEELIQAFNDYKIEKLIKDKDDEIIHLKNKLQNFQNNQSDLLEKFSKSQQCVFDLSNELEKVSQILKMTGEFNQIKKQVGPTKEQQLLEQSFVMKDENILLNSKIESLNTQIEQLNSQIEELNIQNEQQKAQNDHMTDQLQKVQNEEQKYDQLKESYSCLQKEMEEQKYGYLVKENKQAEEISKLKDLVNQNEKNTASLKQANEDLVSQITVNEDKYLQLQKNYEESQQLQQQMNQKIESQNTKIEAKEQNTNMNDKIKEQIKDLQFNLQKRENQKIELEQQNKELNEKLNQQKQQMYKQQESVRQNQEQSRIFQEKLQESSEENQKLKDIIKECKNQIQLDEKNIYKLENELKNLNNQVKSAYKLVNDQQLLHQSSRQSKIGFISMMGSRRESIESKSTKGKLNVSNNSKK